MTVSTQLTLWDYQRKRENFLLDSINGLGPFLLPVQEDVCRHVSCANYDGCLSFAAVRKWPSFSCKGCRKASHGTFE